MELKAGDILHCSGSSLISRLIMKFTKSKFSHTALVIECWGRIHIIEAQNNGVNLKNLDQWIKKYNYKYSVSRPIEGVSNDFFIKASSKIGVTSYDFRSLLLYQPLYILTGKWYGSKKESGTNKMYCSEYVSWVYDFEKYWNKSPQDLFEYLSEMNTFESLNQ